MSGDCKGSDGAGMKNFGYAGDIAAGNDGSFRGARQAAGLFAATGVEAASAAAVLGDLRDQGAITGGYYRSALAAVARRPDRYIPVVAPGVRRELLGQVIAPLAIARDAELAAGAPVGVDVANGCRCTPRDFDAIDPVSGWGIYYVGKGVLLTPTKKCIAGGGGPLGWFAMTWRNVLALFKVPPQNDATLSPELPPIQTPPPTVHPTPTPAETPCEPDNVVGRDDGMFGTGWWIVKGPPGRTGLVPNPNLCP